MSDVSDKALVLIDKIKSRKLTVGIVGLGYVGLPLALAFTNALIKVIGFDIDPSKIRALKKGESYFSHIDSSQIKEAVEKGLLDGTTEFSRVQETDIVILCLPTPLNKYREPDLSYVTGTLESILPYLRKNQVISLESTTYPGTTDEELKTRLEENGFRIGEDFYLIYSPEREDPGNPNFTTRTIPKIVGGTTQNCLKVGTALYEIVVSNVIPVSSTRVAELTKLLENIYRSINIGLVNEMKIIADKMNIDIWEVIEAASSKPFGFTPFTPGPGLGGHCIPIDPFYLTWKAKEYGIHSKFIELSGEVNTSMPSWVINKVSDGLNEREKSIKNSNILIVGLSYKKNIDDIRESPSVELMEILRDKGAKLYYSDPYIPSFPKMREHFFHMESVELTTDILEKMDCVLISTDHDLFDYDLILKHSDLIVDTRGVYRGEKENVIRA
ncbi:nucleotide sugar dehydrogenase [Paenibacillus massiliensis]|uniref:nucleotide sugar dehydrogenase n=1 Tax=Paenibacillus massiliensis TaxID=225917 RepID=UPI00036E3E39|nr:nucleotide sugar dehydrogenase [Paenibacillus massiliensis]